MLVVVLAGLVGCGQNDQAGEPSPTTADGAGRTSTAPSGEGDESAEERQDPDKLTDGTHQVSVSHVEGDAETVTVDGVEVLEGTEAVLAYLADTDGHQLEGPQIYVRNNREELQDLPVDPDGEFAVIFGPRCCEPEDLGWDGFAGLAGSGFADVWGKDPPFEATIIDGKVTSLVQTYIP